jgi:outer membrane lipoprotein SlyB
MKRQLGRVACIIALLLAPGLLGCAIIDNYSGRAVDFNREAEQAQEEVLLLNIVRASLRRPMQFTSLSSVTGSGTVSGGVTGGGTNVKQTPFISQFPGISPAVATTALSRIATGTASGNASLSGTATFTVPILDTQEFYQGILTPIPLQAFDYYLQQGFPPELLYDLFVLKIEVTRLDDGSCRKFTFQNSVRDDLQFGQFQTFIDYLIGSGLTAERINSITSYGPPLPAVRSGPASPADSAAIVEAYSKASSAGLDIRQEGRGPNARVRLQKKSNTFRFCFAYPGGTPSDWVGPPQSAMFCGHFNRRAQARSAESTQADGRAECIPRARAIRAASADTDDEDYDSRSQGIHADGVSEFRGIRLAPEFLRRMDRMQRELIEQKPAIADETLFRSADFAGGLVSFKVYTRSTEGILYYLGELTRRRLFTEFGDVPRTIQVKTGLRPGTMPLTECNDLENGASWQSKNDLAYLSPRRSRSTPRGSYYCENLFVLNNDGILGDHIIGVSYDGMHFSISRDQNRSGRTLQVLGLVKQLLALNTAAKQLPSTSVISVIGQ